VRILVGPGQIEMVAGTGDLESVVAPRGRQAGHLLEGQIGPLAREQGDGMRGVCHCCSFAEGSAAGALAAAGVSAAAGVPAAPPPVRRLCSCSRNSALARASSSCLSDRRRHTEAATAMVLLSEVQLSTVSGPV